MIFKLLKSILNLKSESIVAKEPQLAADTQRNFEVYSTGRFSMEYKDTLENTIAKIEVDHGGPTTLLYRRSVSGWHGSNKKITKPEIEMVLKRTRDSLVVLGSKPVIVP